MITFVFEILHRPVAIVHIYYFILYIYSFREQLFRDGVQLVNLKRKVESNNKHAA